MLITAYVALITVAIAISTFALLPAVFIGAVALGLALREEIKWVIRAPRVTVPPAPHAMPQREG